MYFRSGKTLTVHVIRPPLEGRRFASFKKMLEEFPSPPPPLPPDLSIHKSAPELANELLAIGCDNFFRLAAESYLAFRQKCPFTISASMSRHNNELIDAIKQSQQYWPAYLLNVQMKKQWFRHRQATNYS